jgi:monoterpene epsilon-lactone hydrolase
MNEQVRRRGAGPAALFAVLLGAGVARAGQEADATTLDPDGTAHITRVVPVPRTISPQAQALLAKGVAWAPEGGSEESARLIERARALYPVTIEETAMGGVKVKRVRPKPPPPTRRDRVLINVHGGGFVSDSGSFLESMPIASLTGTEVVAVDYRLAPKNPFPAAVDDTVAVYREVLKAHRARDVALYGTSAGAILTAETAVRLRQLGLPLPAALGFFSGDADLARAGDSLAFFGVPGLEGARVPDRSGSSPYLRDHDPRDPVASPLYADLRGFPPTLCVTGTRDLLLSGTVNFHRALRRAGVPAELVVFDAMPHAHWYMVDVPEAREALETMASFLDEHLGRP